MNFFVKGVIAVVLGFLFISCTVSPQIKKSNQSDFGGWGYTYKEQKKNFRKAKRLQKSGDPKESIRYHILVTGFDSITQESRQSQVFLDSLWKEKIKEVETELFGEWNWIWSGSNWGTGNSPSECNCQKTLVIDETGFAFHENGKVSERFEYKIKTAYHSLITDAFIVENQEGKEMWVITLFTREDGYYCAFLKDMDENCDSFLNINFEYGCACGCPEQRFEKITNNETN